VLCLGLGSPQGLRCGAGPASRYQLLLHALDRHCSRRASASFAVLTQHQHEKRSGDDFGPSALNQCISRCSWADTASERGPAERARGGESGLRTPNRERARIVFSVDRKPRRLFDVRSARLFIPGLLTPGRHLSPCLAPIQIWQSFPSPRAPPPPSMLPISIPSASERGEEESVSSEIRGV
jgi:hypothetical protein